MTCSSPYSNYCHLDFPVNFEIAGEIGLSEINFEFKQGSECFDLCCDICDTSLTQNNQLPILRRVYASKKRQYISYDPIHYIPIVKAKPYFLKVYLRPVSDDQASVDLKTVQCTLHIRESLSS